jgi:AraC-like DNA-binding protein
MVKHLMLPGIIGVLLFLFSCDNKATKEEFVQAGTLLDLADSLSRTNTDTAFLIYQSILHQPSLIGTGYHVRALHGSGKIYAFKSQYDSAGANYDQALAMAGSLNDTVLMIKSRLLKGNNYGETQHYTQSAAEFAEGLKLAKASGALNSQNSFNINLGRLKLFSADYKGAILNFTEGARLAKQANEPYKEGFALEGIAQIMDITGDYAEAIRYNKLAMARMVKYGYQNDIGRVMLNMGLYYKNAAQLDSALYFLDASDAINKKLNNTERQIQVMYNKGLINIDQQKYARAETIMKETYAACIAYKYVEGQAFSLSALSGIYEKKGKPEEALQIIDKSVQLIVDNHLTYKLTDIYKQRHSILSGMGRYKEAYNSTLQLNKLNDSLNSTEKQHELHALKIRYETQIKENEIATLSETLRAKAYTNRIQGMAIVLLIILLLSAAGLSVYIFRLYRLRDAAYTALTRIYRDQMPISGILKNESYSKKDDAPENDAESANTSGEFHASDHRTAGAGINHPDEDSQEITASVLTNILINQKLYLDPNLTADKLAKASGLSRQKLAKAIKDEFGISFFQLLNKYRSQHAVALLHDPGSRMHKIEYIGNKSGFSSRATFYSAFTQHTGLPPAIYRDGMFPGGKADTK